MIKQLFEKWFCKHKWKSHREIKVWDTNNPNSTRPAQIKEVMICENCGKIKVIQIG